MNRRNLLTGTSAVALLSMWRPLAASGQTTGAEQSNLDVVNGFCAAWATRDLSVILPFLSDDCAYRMTETTPAVTGHAGVTERLGSWVERASRIEFKVLESFARGPMVVNHRIDQFIVTPDPLTWEGVGVFFRAAGKITEWFAYTIRVTR